MSSHDDLHRLGFKLKFVYSILGLFLGLACIVAGVVLGLSGVAGHTSWTASLLGLSTSMSDATPGVIIFVVGVFFVLITRFSVRERRGSYSSPVEDGSRSTEQTNATSSEPDAGSGPYEINYKPPV